jgi:hypothetical protein
MKQMSASIRVKQHASYTTEQLYSTCDNIGSIVLSKDILWNDAYTLAGAVCLG